MLFQSGQSAQVRTTVSPRKETLQTPVSVASSARFSGQTFLIMNNLGIGMTPYAKTMGSGSVMYTIEGERLCQLTTARLRRFVCTDKTVDFLAACTQLYFVCENPKGYTLRG
jgi:hypothetical protein